MYYEKKLYYKIQKRKEAEEKFFSYENINFHLH